MSYDNLSSVSQNVLKFYQQLTEDRHGETSIPPYNFVAGGIKKTQSSVKLCPIPFNVFK
jgi:hypothetical protein